MPTDPRWTDETRNSVARALFNTDRPHGTDWWAQAQTASPLEVDTIVDIGAAKVRAAAILNTLANAGLLLPPGGTAEEKRGYWNPEKQEVQTWWSYHNHGFKMPDRVRTVTTWPDGSVHTGPWRPVDEAQP